MKLLPGIVACVLLAVVATLLGIRFPIVGAPVFAILMGVAIAAGRTPAPVWVPGTAFASKTLLQCSIVLLGANLSLAQIARGGSSALAVMLGTFALVLVLAYACGRMLGLDRDLRRLLAIGTAICGGSAIAAVASVIDVNRSDVAYALGTVFLFNIIAVLTFPPWATRCCFRSRPSACGRERRSTTRRRSWRQRSRTDPKPATTP